MKKIKLLCKIIGRDLATIYKGDTISALWPFTTNEAEYYIGEFFIKELFFTLKKLKEKGYSKEKIAELFYRPSKIAQYFTLFHSSIVLERTKRIRLARDLLSYISYYREDPFCKRKENLLKKSIFNKELLNISLFKKMCRTESKLTSLLLLYLEFLFPTAMRLGHEFHGPYRTKEGYILIKEFYNLNPKYFEFSRNFPYKNIICIELVKKKPKLDFFNHLIFMPKKEKCAILVNGKELNKKESEKITKNIENYLQKIYEKTKYFNKKEFLILLAKGYFYSLENLKKEIGEKIILPKQFYKKITKEKFELDIEKITENIKRTKLKKLREKIEKSYLKIFKK